MISHKLFGWLAICVLIQHSFLANVEANTHQCATELFAEGKQHISKDTFSIHEKVYLHALCRELKPGTYEMVSVWHRPSGQIQRQDSHVFTLKTTSGYRVEFWMKLHQKSPLQETLANAKYADGDFGGWTVNVYLNQELAGRKKFTLR